MQALDLDLALAARARQDGLTQLAALSKQPNESGVFEAIVSLLSELL